MASGTLHLGTSLEGGTCLVLQWLRLCASKAGGICLSPSHGTKIPYAMWRSRKKKKKKTSLEVTYIISAHI